jgi:hypothetical protein
MSLRQYEYALAVAEEGSVTAAAEVLRVAQPSLSQQIRGLERELGVQLFTRTPTGLVPTGHQCPLSREFPCSRSIVDYGHATGPLDCVRILDGMAIDLRRAHLRGIAVRNSRSFTVRPETIEKQRSIVSRRYRESIRAQALSSAAR